jgi:hypothetical protein
MKCHKAYVSHEFRVPVIKKKVIEAVPVSGRGGLQGYEMSRLPHFLGSLLRDGCDVSLTRQPSFTPSPQGRFLVINFCQRLSKLQGHMRAKENIRVAVSHFRWEYMKLCTDEFLPLEMSGSEMKEIAVTWT